MRRARATAAAARGSTPSSRSNAAAASRPWRWGSRQPPLDFGPELEFHKPLGGNPTWGRWRRFIDHLLELGEDYLLVIDTVMTFLPTAPLRERVLWEGPT
jgi:hypothetical protein